MTRRFSGIRKERPGGRRGGITCIRIDCSDWDCSCSVHWDGFGSYRSMWKGTSQQVYPRAVIILISLASLGLCLRSEPRVKAKPIPPEDRPARLMAALKLVGLMAAYLAYLLLIPRLGLFLLQPRCRGVFPLVPGGTQAALPAARPLHHPDMRASAH